MSGKILISGASGMVGKVLVNHLRTPSSLNAFKPNVITLVRHTPRSSSEIWWNPMESQIDLAALEGVEAIIHLAGENIGSGEGPLAAIGRWSDRKKHLIMESRRRGTTLLARAIASMRTKPKIFVTASGVGYYGSCGDTILTEKNNKGTGFLSEVADVWESSTSLAKDAGVRVVNLRFGVILSKNGGVIEKLYWPFFFGGGGPVGSGEQYMSWIALQDAIRAIEFSLFTESLTGPVNACSPNPERNKDFMSALGYAMNRPAFVPLPEAAVNLIFGEMGQETLLGSQRAIPQKLVDSGFIFKLSEIKDAMNDALA